MTSTFSTNKRLELPGYNDYIDSWNVPLNADMTAVDTALGGSTLLNATSPTGTVTLTYTQYRPLSIIVSGSMSADVFYTIPAGVGGQWTVTNGTTGPYSVYMVSAAGGASVRIPQGYSTIVSCDGGATGMRLSINVPVLAAGSSGQVQYNLSGSFAGSSNLTFDGTTLSVVGLSASGSISATDSIVTNNSLRSQISGGATGQVLLGNSTYRLYYNGAGTFDLNGNLLVSGSTTATGAVYSDSFRFRSDGVQDTGIDWKSDGVLKFVNNNLETGTINASGVLTMGNNIITTGTGLKAGNGEVGEKQIYLHNNNRSVYFYLGADGNSSGLYDSNANHNRWTTNSSGDMSVYRDFTVNGTLYSVGSVQVTAGYVYLAEATGGANTRSLHNNSGTIGFLNTSSAWVFRVADSGDAIAAGNVITGNGAGGYVLSGVSSYNVSYTANSVQLAPSTGSVFSKNTTVAVNQIVFNNPNGQVGFINTDGSSTSYGTTSDYRLKYDVQPMINSLSTISALKPSTYKWKVSGANGEGFIAHELQEVIPHAVSGVKDAVNEDGSIKPQGVDYGKIVVYLVAAMQEQQKQINDLTAKVEALEAKG